MNDAQAAAFWPAFWPAIGVTIGVLGSEFRNFLSRRTEERRKDRVDAIAELTSVIGTLKQESAERDTRHINDMKERDEKHAADMHEIRGAHSDCQQQYEELKADHEALKLEFAEFKKSVTNGGSHQ